MSVHPFSSSEHVDVLIVGAGISGIGTAYYLQKEHPFRSYAILEGRDATGGTWDLFRYPGIRSDSDLHTFGYPFKPWVDDKAIAGADAILAYVRGTAAENDIDRKVRFHHKVRHAEWSSEDARWTVEIERGDTGERLHMTCKWLFCAVGYYRYDQGFTPSFEGSERFKGPIVHPQHWPENLDYAGKKVVVIGSGATAVTLVPAMADKAAHVTMLQRTPSYVLNLPSEDVIANVLRKILPADWAYRITRRKNIALSHAIVRLCQRYPQAMKRVLRYLSRKQLPDGYPVDEHFNPPYKPWDQRMCIVPDGDLFKVISAGKASVVTNHIASFSEKGVVLTSGEELEADIIVTATGLNLQVLGGISLAVDGKAVDVSRKVAFRGMMLDGVPNLAFAIGYTTSSWTLKVGLLSEHFCRLLSYMASHGHAVCCPELPSPDMPTRPLLDFGAGYIQRSINTLPRQGEKAPWLMSMDFHLDAKLLKEDSVEDENLKFYSPSAERSGEAMLGVEPAAAHA